MKLSFFQDRPTTPAPTLEPVVTELRDLFAGKEAHDALQVWRDAGVLCPGDRRALAPVLTQLRTPFDGDGALAHPMQTWRTARVLQRESTVYLVSQGTHSFVFVSSPRLHHGRPLLGKIYSTFIFDPYRRPYRFNGNPHAVAQAWEDRCLTQGLQAFDEALAPVFAAAYAATSPEERAQHVQTIEGYRARLNERRSGPRQSATVAATLAGMLAGLKGVRYPAIDMFLLDVRNGLMEVLTVAEAEAVVRDCFADFAHANGDKGMKRREIWPMFDEDSWRIDHDQLWALTVDNKVRTGSAVTHDWCDVLPNAEAGKPLTAEQAAGRKNLEALLKIVMRYEPQPVSHDAVRAAFRLFLLGMWRFDEKMQRNVAVNTRAITAPISQKQARAMQKKFFATFHTLPYGRGPQRGNCNSIAKLLLETAMELEGRGAKPVFPSGLPKLGKNHVLKLPRPRVLP